MHVLLVVACIVLVDEQWSSFDPASNPIRKHAVYAAFVSVGATMYDNCIT